jgi:hypothetical protein
MTQFILLQDAAPQLNEKVKAKMLDNYAKTIQERRARQLRRVKGTVRQLYTEGHPQEADAIWDQCMQLNNDCSNDDSSTSSQE